MPDGREVDVQFVDVLIVDDDPLVRAWLRASLRRSEFRIAAEAGSTEEAVALLARRNVVLLLVDYRLAGGSGIDLIRALRRSENRTPAVLMTAVPERGLNERAREAGAQATLLKTVERDDLLACLRSTVAGRGTFDPGHPRRPPDEQPLATREREVLEALAAGLTNREIAQRLAIGEESVKTYVERLYAKLGVQRRSEAVDAAHRLGLLGR